MQTSFPLDVYRSDLTRVANDVFQAMMDLPIELREAWSAPAEVVTASVYLAGEWRGAVLVECARPQAYAFTSRFMGVEAPALDDMRDTMGEIANMLAGNLKSVLPRGVGLSMPSVVEGTDYSLRVCGGNSVERIAFSSPIGEFCVTLIEMLV